MGASGSGQSTCSRQRNGSLAITFVDLTGNALKLRWEQPALTLWLLTWTREAPKRTLAFSPHTLADTGPVSPQHDHRNNGSTYYMTVDSASHPPKPLICEFMGPHQTLMQIGHQWPNAAGQENQGTKEPGKPSRLVKVLKDPERNMKGNE